MTPNFEQLVNLHGLVPMRITDDNFAPYAEGSIAGFPPEEAERLFGRGSAIPVNEAGEVVAVAITESRDPAPEPEREVVEIPDDILEAHHLKRVALAKLILGKDDAITAAQADDVILAELEKRRK